MSEFNDACEEFLDGLPESYVPAVEAERFAALMDETHPGLVDAWLHDRRVAILTAHFSQIRTAQRRHVTRTRDARRFGEQAASGEIDPSVWKVTFRVADDDTQKQLGAMTGADHLFVASGYESDSKRASMLAAFHRAVAKKVGKRRTCDVFTPAEYQRLHQSITGDEAEAA